MATDSAAHLEARIGLNDVAGAAADTREYLSSASGSRLASRLIEHLRAYAALDDLVPYFGDHRLPYTESSFQLKNSVCLAYSGLYVQAYATLRSVCELSLLQAALPEGPVVTERQLELLRTMLPPDLELPAIDDVNWVLPGGFGAQQSPDRAATTLEEWAIDGCRTLPWGKMFNRLMALEHAERFARETQLRERFADSMADLDSYVHARGRLRTGTELCGCNAVRFNASTLFQFATRMMCTVQISVTLLLVAFLPTATTHPDAAAGFIDAGNFELALRVLPAADAHLLRIIDSDRRGRGESV
ncbi:MAG: hypothetical protein RBS57_09250 [Desulforhabdus sp.]|jgi:hypothetical protein|nr:hypothetical protein [Desulforhabdus sp.]